MSVHANENDAASSRWQSEDLTSAFLEGVRAAIPAAALQLETLARIVSAWRPAPARILDLGCGDGALGRSLMARFPGARVTFADFSEPMLAAARRRLLDAPAAHIVTANFASPAWREAVGAGDGFDVIVSGFAIHHQPGPRKRALYAEIHDALRPGGVFLNLEHVASATPAGEQLFDDLFIDSLYAHHATANPSATRESVASEYYHRSDKKENMLAPVSEQCGWLLEIGFQDVDCFFKLFELALFGGRRAQ